MEKIKLTVIIENPNFEKITKTDGYEYNQGIIRAELEVEPNEDSSLNEKEFMEFTENVAVMYNQHIEHINGTT